MLKRKFPHKILWLASYPKSGNTWFRAFLTALMNEGTVEINKMGTDGMFSNREIFDYVSDFESRELYDDEAKLMIAEIYRYVAEESRRLKIIKVHDAFEENSEGENIIPENVTLAAIYFVRNPLDLVGSLANHFQIEIGQAISILNDKNAWLLGQKNNLNIYFQFPQHMSDWSGHVKSWTSKPSFPVHVIRYEDMVREPFKTFSELLKQIGWDYTDVEIEQAIEASSFKNLRKQEEQNGFNEFGRGTGRFFRSGSINNWRNELTSAQILDINRTHTEMMSKFGYELKFPI